MEDRPSALNALYLRHVSHAGKHARCTAEDIRRLIIPCSEDRVESSVVNAKLEAVIAAHVGKVVEDVELALKVVVEVPECEIIGEDLHHRTGLHAGWYGRRDLREGDGDRASEIVKKSRVFTARPAVVKTHFVDGPCIKNLRCSEC